MNDELLEAALHMVATVERLADAVERIASAIGADVDTDPASWVMDLTAGQTVSTANWDDEVD